MNWTNEIKKRKHLNTILFCSLREVKVYVFLSSIKKFLYFWSEFLTQRGLKESDISLCNKYLPQKERISFRFSYYSFELSIASIEKYEYIYTKYIYITIFFFLLGIQSIVDMKTLIFNVINEEKSCLNQWFHRLWSHLTHNSSYIMWTSIGREIIVYRKMS